MQMILLFLLQEFSLKHLMASFSAACCVQKGGVGLSFSPHSLTSPPLACSVAAILPSPPLPCPRLPTLSLPASHGLCLWLNAGILSQRLPVAKRDGAPEEAGQNVCGSLQVRRRLFILLFPDSTPFSLSSSFLCLYSFSVLTSKKLRLISVCPVIRFFLSPSFFRQVPNGEREGEKERELCPL